MWGPPFPTVCEKYSNAEMVVTGKVLSVELEGAAQKVVVAIDKTFKGKHQRKITLYQPQSTCDRDFFDDDGKSVLLYLVQNKETGRYRNNSPSSGGLAERSSEELYWLDGLPGSLKRTRISGTIDLYEDDPFEFVKSISGVKVTVFTEKKSYTAMTDKNGVYEVWDLPRGEYSILPVFPSSLRFGLVLSKGEVEFKQISKDEVDTENFKVSLSQLGCGGADFVLKPK